MLQKSYRLASSVLCQAYPFICDCCAFIGYYIKKCALITILIYTGSGKLDNLTTRLYKLRPPCSPERFHLFQPYIQILCFLQCHPCYFTTVHALWLDINILGFKSLYLFSWTEKSIKCSLLLLSHVINLFLSKKWIPPYRHALFGPH